MFLYLYQHIYNKKMHLIQKIIRCLGMVLNVCSIYAPWSIIFALFCRASVRHRRFLICGLEYELIRRPNGTRRVEHFFAFFRSSPPFLPYPREEAYLSPLPPSWPPARESISYSDLLGTYFVRCQLSQWFQLHFDHFLTPRSFKCGAQNESNGLNQMASKNRSPYESKTNIGNYKKIMKIQQGREVAKCLNLENDAPV